MRLIDCYVPALAAASYLRQDASRQPEYDVFLEDVLNLLKESRESAERGGFSTADFDTARFAVCAFIDETVRNCDWQGAERWTHAPLQRAFYETTNAGWEFFERLENISENNTGVREVYTTCLAMGFTGRYFDPDDGEELANIRRRELTLLWGDTFDDVDLAKEAIFPQGLPARFSGTRFFPE